MKFHGIDLHHDSLLDMIAESDDISNLKSKKYYLKGDSFKKFKESLSKDDYAVIESCSNAFWLYDEIKDLVKECYILNTIKFRNMMNKNDKIDAKKLAKKLAFYVLHDGDDDDMPTIFIPVKEVREIRGLFVSLKLFKKQNNQIKSRIYSILRENGVQIEKKEMYSPDILLKLNEIEIAESWKFQIELLLDQLDNLNKQEEKIKLKIKKSGYKIFADEIKLLISIQGFSIITAIAVMADVVDINRFPNVKKFCAYLRTAPGVSGSNKKNIIKGTNKQSRSLSISFLSQSVNHFGKAGDYLTNFYKRVKKGKKAGVYRMAIIRKVLVSAYFMLKRKESFYWYDEKNYERKLIEMNRDINRFKKSA
jgi:transposase